MLKNEKLQLALFCLAHVVILLPLFDTIYRMTHATTPLYLEYATRVFNGSFPYRDFYMEYPPFSLVFFLLPRLFGSSLSVFAGAYQIEVLIFDLLGLFLIYRIAQITGRAPWKMMAMYSVAILAIGPLIIETYDIFPAILTLASLYCFYTDRHKLSWFFLALGVMTKLYPVVIAPIYIFFYLRDRKYKYLWTGIVTAAATCLIISLPFVIATPDGLFNILTLHGTRPIQLETTYSSILLMSYRFSGTNPPLDFSIGSNNLVGPVPDALAKISLYLMLFLLLLSYILIFTRIQKRKLPVTETATAAMLGILILLITGKILSPQYLIWLLPLLPLISGKKGYIITAVFVVIGALTYYVYPLHYAELGDTKAPVVVVLFVRNILLILFTVLTAVFIFRSKSGKNTLESNS